MKFIDIPLYKQQIIIIIFILALVFSIINLFIATRIYKNIWFKITSIISFILLFSIIFLTMRGSYLYRVNRPVFEPSFTIIQWPFEIFYFLSLALLILMIILFIISFFHQNISSISIKESVDTIPRGICFYEKSGLVRLINIEMNNIWTSIFGHALLNGVNFYNAITHGELEKNYQLIKTSDESIVICPNNKVISFKQILHNIEGNEIYEIIATDITEEYQLTIELKNNLNKLQIINQRLISYRKNIFQLSQEKEILSTKIRIHNNMGKLLITTKRKLSIALTEEEKKQLLSFWHLEINGLKSPHIPNKKNNLQVILEAAKLVNVKIENSGTYPPIDSIEEKILINAMHECLTNTVSHANGKKMKEKKYSVMIVEDQQMPKTLFSHYIENSEHFYLQTAIENASIADIICTRTPVDLILMDVVTENGESGLIAAEKIKKKFPKIKIIIVTSMPECSYIQRAKKIGVEGFWYKEINEQPIISIMEKVMNGETIYPEHSQIVKVGLATSTEFTEKELEILRFILGGYSNIEIAQKLNVSPGVIKNHVADMLLKTGFRSRTQLAVRARETGLVILDKLENEI